MTFKRKRLLLGLMIWILLMIPLKTAFAESDMLEKWLPQEEDLGVQAGDRTLDYRAFPVTHYGWDIGYDMIEWEWGGIKPKLNDPLPVISNGLYGVGFMIHTLIVHLSIWLMQLAFHTDLINQQLEVVTPLMSGLKNSLFVPFLPFSLIFLVVWAVKKGYWDNQTTQLWSGLLGAILILAGSLWFMSHSGQSVRAVSVTVDRIAQVVMGSVASPYQRITGDVLRNPLEAADHQLIATSNRLWKLLVDRPWQIGEFNRQDASDVRMTKDEVEGIRKLAEEAKLTLDIREGDAWANSIRKYPSTSEERRILRLVMGDSQIDHGNHNDISRLFRGQGVDGRGLILLLSLLSSICFLLFIAVVAGIMVVAQEIALAVILIAPVIFLVGMVPERGFALILRWTAWLLGALGTKVVYGFYVGVTLLLADVLARSSGFLMIQQILVAILFVVALLYRKRILQTLLGAIKSPTPHDVYDHSKQEVQRHWSDTKETWMKTKKWVGKWFE
ncbi:hypothetical protein [Effusibacillus consociatus]|uniref:Uncharacterized protein n=1 Tax=Effusibacillus consociatus TaxID=1117041 RepID=A0ABV9PY36_9BACL